MTNKDSPVTVLRLLILLSCLSVATILIVLFEARDRPAECVPSDRTAGSEHTGQLRDACRTVFEPSIVSPSTADQRAARGIATKPGLRVRMGHVGRRIDFVAVSTDGKYLLSGDDSSTTILWRLDKRIEVQRYMESAVRTAVFVDGTTFVTGDFDGNISIWTVGSPTPYYRFKAHEHWITSLAVSSTSDAIISSSIDASVRTWDVKTWREIARMDPPLSRDAIGSVALSDGGRYLAVGKKNGALELWSVGDRKRVQEIDAHTSPILAVAVSPDGSRIISRAAGADMTVRLWDCTSRRQIYAAAAEINRAYSIRRLPDRFSPDGTYVAVAAEQHQARILFSRSGEELHRLSEVDDPTSAFGFIRGRDQLAAALRGGTVLLIGVSKANRIGALSSAGTSTYDVLSSVNMSSGYLVTQDAGSKIHFWDLDGGRRTIDIGNHEEVLAMSRSANDNWLLTAHIDSGNDTRSSLSIYDTRTGRFLRRLSREIGETVWSGFSAHDRYIVTLSEKVQGSEDGINVRLAQSGKRVVGFRSGRQRFSAVAMSVHGRKLFIGEAFEPARGLGATTTESPVLPRSYYVSVRKFPGRNITCRLIGHEDVVSTILPLNDERFVLTASQDQTIRLWDVDSCLEIRRYIGHDAQVGALCLLEDGKHFVSGSVDGTAKLWSVESPSAVRTFVGHEGHVTGVASLQKGKFIATSSTDGMTKIWNVATGKEELTLVGFANDIWVAVAPDGRFDSNNLEEIKGLEWVFEDNPLDPLPVEIFMREYYEPRLLSRMISGVRLPALPSLASLNWTQPKISIAKVEHITDDTVRVSVDVSGRTQEFNVAGARRSMSTGVYDLRLFRDGQLVGQWPDLRSTTAEGSNEDERANWRQTKLIAKTNDGSNRIVFEGIRLPRVADLHSIKFTAYAFNVDQVKSETVSFPYQIPKELTPRQGVAYIVSVGVNRFESASWNLGYAVNDAKMIQTSVGAQLAELRDKNGEKRYGSVITVPLISPLSPYSSAPDLQASKAQIKTVIQILSGQHVEKKILETVPNWERLRRAYPEDLVIISFSTHGIVNKNNGRFFLLPSDIGADFSATNEQLRSAISNEELASWLHGLDARDQVLLIDACHSAASVQSGQFKPGPMGSRGLGQLAYDQGMQILAATQIDQYALETDETRLGLLSYALAEDGMKRRRADYKPKDGDIYLGEWLSYAAERVPQLYARAERQQGMLKGKERGEVIWKVIEGAADLPRGSLQQPQIFNFARKEDTLISSTVSLR